MLFVQGYRTYRNPEKFRVCCVNSCNGFHAEINCLVIGLVVRRGVCRHVELVVKVSIFAASLAPVTNELNLAHETA